VTPEAVAQTAQAVADDELLAQLASAGLTPIVVDENTDFSTLPRLT
jgi:hypothetical protein